jgi:tape measure domain-containing protein
MTEIPLMLTIDGSKGRAEVDKTRTSLDKFKDSGKQVEQQNARVTNSFDLMKRAATALAAGLSVQKIIQYSDTWKQLQGRLELATKGQADFNSKQAQLYDLAQRNRQSLEGVYTLYNRLSMAVGNNAKAQQGLIGVTEAFAKGLAITGESAQAAQGAIIQFSQGLATSFKAGGQELNSLMEQAPRVAKALADGLNEIGASSNATSGNLKELAQGGVLSVNNVVAALQSQLPKLAAEFEKIPRTVGQAFTQIDNAFLRYIGQSQLITTGTNSIAAALGMLAENFDLVADTALVTATVLGGIYLAKLGAAVTLTVSATGAMAGLSAVMKAVPILALVAGIVYLSQKLGGLSSVAELVSLSFDGLVGALIKFGNSVWGISKGVIAGFTGMFGHIGDLFNAFSADLSAFVTDPFGFNGFERLSAAMSKGFVDSFATAYSEVLKETESFNASIDAELKDRAEKTFKGINERMAKATTEAQKLAAGGNDIKDALKDLNPAMEKAGKTTAAVTGEMKQLREQVDPIAEAFKNAATGIQNSFTGAFRDILDGNGGLKSFARRMLDVFKDMISQMATIAITNPIIIPMVQAVGGALGIGGEALSGITSQLGGGAGGVSAVSGGGSIISGLMNGFNTPILSTGGVVNIANMLGFGGNTAATGSLLSMASNLTPLTGIAGFGGGLLSSMVFGGGTGNSIGSTLGGAIGGLALGPLGALGGSFLGGALGSLFGKKKPSSKLATGNLDLLSGNLTRGGFLPGDKKFDQGNYDEVGTLAQIAARIAMLTGGASGSLSIASGNREGLQGGFDGASVTYGENVNGFLKAIITGIAERGKEVSDPLRKAIENIDWTNAKDNIEKIITDLTTAANYERVRDQFNAGLSGQLLSPYGRARMEAQQNLSAMLAQAQAVGGSIDLVYKVHEQTLQEIEKQYSTVNQEMQRTAENATNLSRQFSALADSLGNALFSLRTGSLSALSPLDKLNAARGEFQTVSAGARMGDVAAMQRLPEVANTFLSLSRQYNASTEAFAQDFAAVEAALMDAQRTAQRQVGLQQEIANNTLAQVNATNGLGSILLASQTARSLSTGDFSGRSFGAGNANQNVVNNLAAIQAGGMMGTVEALLQTFTFGVTPGQNRRSQFFDLFPAQNEAFIAEAKRLGIPGFANGGMTPANRPFMVGERGPEIMSFGRSGVVQPITANDNAALAKVSKQLEALTLVTAKGLSQTNERLAAAVARLDNIDATNRISAA